jgi:meso-butanediol dehydrogenase/(S,S)-butanediol dehydrogenase/diacetyl reductase
MSLESKIAIVTGAARGIGRATAILLAGEGVKTVLSDILSLEDTINDIVSAGGEAIGEKCDVSENSDVENLIKTARDRYGKIDILVNVAGVTTVCPVHKMDEKDWDFVMGVNAKGVFLTNRAVIPYMMKQKSGKIVNVSSDAGKVGYGGLAHYSASKFAIIGFTQSLAKEMGEYNVNVNVVCPGMVYTPMWEKVARSEYANLIFPSIGKQKRLNTKEIFLTGCEEANVFGRPQSPEDIAHMIVFLVSDKADNITGQAINVDSGQVFH